MTAPGANMHHIINRSCTVQQ